MPGPRHQLLDHPHRETIEAELALSDSRVVGEKWNINPRALRHYRQKYMTAEQIARIRGLVPSQAEVDIEKLVREGGTEAVVGLSRIITEAKAGFEACTKLGLHGEAVKYQKIQLEAFKAKGNYAGLIPGRKTVNNNTLMIGNMQQFMDFVDAALAQFPDARRALANAWASQHAPALEHEG